MSRECGCSRHADTDFIWRSIRAPADAVLVEDGRDMPESGYAVRFALGLAGTHSLGCACCTLRGPAADALGRLFRERATGAAPFFRTGGRAGLPAGEAAVRQGGGKTDVV